MCVCVRDCIFYVCIYNIVSFSFYVFEFWIQKWMLVGWESWVNVSITYGHTLFCLFCVIHVSVCVSVRIYKYMCGRSRCTFLFFVFNLHNSKSKINVSLLFLIFILFRFVFVFFFCIFNFHKFTDKLINSRFYYTFKLLIICRFLRSNYLLIFDFQTIYQNKENISLLLLNSCLQAFFYLITNCVSKLMT